MDSGSEAFGYLRPSADAIGDPGELQERLHSDGYLYLPDYLDRDQAGAIRLNLLEKLDREGLLDPQYPVEAGVLRPDANLSFRPDLAREDPQIRKFLFTGKLMELFRGLLNGEVLSFTEIWLRAISRGNGTLPHCDFPFMGRGTFGLYTAWVPYGQVPLEIGGLMLLEGSHHQQERLRNYIHHDVDGYCTNKPWGQLRENGWSHRGHLTNNAASLREKLGGRWLTAVYNPGDLLIFGMGLVHASLDNSTQFIRLSSDTRYQRADEPVDERWIGQNPVGHGPAGKKGLIC